MKGNVGFVNLRELGLALRDAFGLTTFIETGTYKAITAAWAADNFKKVITIEAHRNYHVGSKKAHKDKENITFIFGDSRTELPKVLARLRKPALIWLDAHWCGDYEQSKDTAGECPLKEELQALHSSKVRHLILIDDARLFVNPPPKPHDPAQWPTMAQIGALLPDGYEVTIWNDAIIAMPSEAMPVVRRFADPQKMEAVVLASNAYLHCLPPFAYLFNKFWGANQPVKVVRYEIRPRNLPGNFANFAIGKQEDYTWSSGLIKYLQHHGGELILLMLEDYFLSESVDTEHVQAMWNLMIERPEITKIDLSDDRLKVPHTQYGEILIKTADDAPFQTSLQAAIWRKDFLLRFLDPTENPWQFERRGTKRVIAARQKGEFDGLILGCKTPPLTYVNAVGGEGNNPGEWDLRKFPQWMASELRGRGLMS